MISVEKLNKTYQKHSRNANKVLHDLTFTLPDTGFVCILGPSGCGKTSLLNAIGGLDTFDNGTITTESVSVSRPNTRAYNQERNQSFGYIFQNYYLLSEHSVGYNVYLGLHSLKLSHKEKLARVMEALKAVDMDRYIRRNVGELSGGQQQRIAIARAIARRPKVIFADEPTGNLDEANTMNICTLLRQISRTSLVVMVTHEERIANFFADRIITLSEGRIRSDSQDWQRSDLSLSQTATVYAGDYQETKLQQQGIELRLLTEEDAPTIQLTVVATKDRLVIKLNDSRQVQLGSDGDVPVLAEGKRPVLTLEQLEGEADLKLTKERTAVPSKAGWGLKFPELFREAAHMHRQSGLRSLGARIFLILLAILTTITAGDFLTVASVDPEDFIISDSHILTVDLARGPNMDSLILGIDGPLDTFAGKIANSGLEYEYLPVITADAMISGSLFLQTSGVTTRFQKFSYVPMQYLRQEQLLFGRMPENGEEVVVDRWVLDKLMEQDGILQNSILSDEQFLGKRITYSKRNLSPVIVGICDSGQPAIYAHSELFASVGVTGSEVASLSTLKARYPGVYDHITLAEGECLVVPAKAGITYEHKLGSHFTTLSGKSFRITGIVSETDFWPKIVVADDQIQALISSMVSARFQLYCQDKAAMTQFLQNQTEITDGVLVITVTDRYGQTMAAYEASSQLRLDARLIVTFTIMALALVMLYLLRRSQVQDRIGMLSVYRLLGIPRRKIGIIFLLECLLATLTTVLPSTMSVWAVVALLSQLPSVGLEFVLPWYAALGVCGAVALYHLLVTLIPLMGLMKLPPAQLAAKYDF